MLLRYVCLVLLSVAGISAHAAELCSPAELAKPVYKNNIAAFSPQTQFNVITAVSREALSVEANKLRPGDTDGITALSYAQDVRLTFKQAPSGCLLPVVRIKLGPQTAAIYIAHEVAPGSCRFDAVYAHEMRHARAAQEVFDSTAERLTEEVREFFASPTAREILASAPAPVAELTHRLEKMARIAISEGVFRLNDANAIIDSPAEAARMASRCPQAPQMADAGPN